MPIARLREVVNRLPGLRRMKFLDGWPRLTPMSQLRAYPGAGGVLAFFWRIDGDARGFASQCLIYLSELQ